jgi:hypothetical protein
MHAALKTLNYFQILADNMIAINCVINRREGGVNDDAPNTRREPIILVYMGGDKIIPFQLEK